MKNHFLFLIRFFFIANMNYSGITVAECVERATIGNVRHHISNYICAVFIRDKLHHIWEK